MGNPNQKIIVVDRKKLFEGQSYFEGFYPLGGTDYESRIIENLKVMRRGSTNEPADYSKGNAEMNVSYKQPIGYAILANLKEGKVFAYQRSSGDARLIGKWSWGFGGHIEPFDSNGENVIRQSLVRELGEEAGLEGDVRMRVLGYINEDIQKEEDSKLNRPSIGRVHFGVLYLIDTDLKKLSPKDPEIESVELKTTSELEKLCNTPGVTVEEWSRTALVPLRQIL